MDRAEARRRERQWDSEEAQIRAEIVEIVRQAAEVNGETVTAPSLLLSCLWWWHSVVISELEEAA